MRDLRYLIQNFFLAFLVILGGVTFSLVMIGVLCFPFILLTLMIGNGYGVLLSVLVTLVSTTFLLAMAWAAFITFLERNPRQERR